MTRLQEYFTELIKAFNECHSNLLIDVTEEDIHKEVIDILNIKKEILYKESVKFLEQLF